MKSPAAAELLNVWEEGLSQSLLEKSLHLLRVACSTDLTTVADLSIGDRDVRLLQLREWLFGSRLLNKASCPNCAETVEWKSQVSDLRLQPISDRINAFSLEKEGFIVQFRLPTSRDMQKVLSENNDETNSSDILSECIISASKNGEQVAFEDFPETLVNAMNERMEQEDPQADIQMLMNCPNCANQWNTTFDIGSYLWAEIDHWAKKTLEEIMILARTFGWSEGEILRLSPQRRQIYLDMIGS